MWGNMGLLPLLFILRLSGVYSGHSLQYYLTAVSVPGHGLPVFSEVGYVDGIEIVHYTSDIGQEVPVAPWMQKVEDPDYWDRETQRCKATEPVFKQNVKTLMNRYNQTGGFHIIQRMYGCELRDDGSSRGYYQYGYDGKDFTALDTERWVYYPLTDQAQVTAQKWNSPEEREGERDKNYLENICIDWLKKYLEYGKEELEKRVRPEVKVSGHPSGSAMKLHCQVFGFYPRDVDVNWKKNGMDIPSDEAKHVFPNSDGTYQLRASVEVTPEDGASYSCHVDHSSLKEPLLVMWDPKGSKEADSNMAIIIGVVVGVIVVALLVGVVFWMKKRSGNKKPGYAPEYLCSLISDPPHMAPQCNVPAAMLGRHLHSPEVPHGASLHDLGSQAGESLGSIPRRRLEENAENSNTHARSLPSLNTEDLATLAPSAGGLRVLHDTCTGDPRLPPFNLSSTELVQFHLRVPGERHSHDPLNPI